MWSISYHCYLLITLILKKNPDLSLINRMHSPFQNYQLQIQVNDTAGNTCNGTLNVKVLPVYQNSVNFT